MTDAWAAPYADGPVNARVVVPGSKSLTNRALILAALADGPSTLSNVLEARDTLLMVDALRQLGVSLTRTADGRLDVTPTPLRGPARIDVGLAGTVMRFMPPVAALADGDVHFDGDARARVRPMGAIVDALRQLGVAVDDDGRAALPFTVRGTGAVSGRDVTIDASASSQFVSALLLSGARFSGGVCVRHRGGDLPSLPHIDMTIDMLRASDVDVAYDTSDSRNAWWSIAPGPIAARDRTIEPDLSNAAPFLAAAMVTCGSVTIPDWPAVTTQAGAALRDILQLMGGQVYWSASGLTVTGPTELVGIDIDMRNEGELAPTIAAMCALATTPSRLRGIAHLRGHETDRISALALEINRLGGDVREEADGLTINPAPLHAGDVSTYDDHRMATAGAILGLAVRGVRVRDIETTRKTLPDFPGMWSSMLGGV